MLSHTESYCYSHADACYGRWEDVVSIPKISEDFRLLYDTKRRFYLHAITGDETKFKLCKVRSVQFYQKGIPYLNTYDSIPQYISWAYYPLPGSSDQG
ncbi:hypothetical protein V6N11_042804 [Hibiscus sabdariffa]|uniref:Small ribosomal subunit protein eS4 central region domain-containing protein n=1 Tax=Hibiscus sabdariffa TaxID=183260 RepID=A0ABR2QXE7_9ROSI